MRESESDLFSLAGGELPLSNRGQLELLYGMRERDAGLRTVVRGGSMAPFVRDGDVVVVAPLRGVAPRVGEVVAVELARGATLAVHRVVRRSHRGVLVRGDNAAAADGVVPPPSVLGRVVRVERGERRVRFGMGPERRVIAALSCLGLLRPLTGAARRAYHALAYTRR
ncbi:MAG: S24/S26 family peptidase [Thermoleophilia bacterium]